MNPQIRVSLPSQVPNGTTSIDAFKGLRCSRMKAWVEQTAAAIALLGPVSGAHFNPPVSLVEALRGALLWREAAAYVPNQIVGCCAGAVLAHAMFSLPLIQSSHHERTGIVSGSASSWQPWDSCWSFSAIARPKRHLGWSPPGSERLTGSPRQHGSRIRRSPSPVPCRTPQRDDESPRARPHRPACQVISYSL